MIHTIKPVVVGALETNCWIYPLPGPAAAGGKMPCAVIDPGADPDRIIARMGELHLYPRYFLLTHGHFDHLAALPALVRFTADSPAEIALHREDAAYLGAASRRIHREGFIAAAGSAAYVDDLWEDLPPPGRLLDEGDTIGPLTVLHLSGHSPGSAAFYDRAAGILFSGDTLFRAAVGRADLPGGDGLKLEASLRRLFALDGKTAVYPGHGPATTIGEERGFW